VYLLHLSLFLLQVFLPAILPPVQYLLGWSAFVPFAFISDDGAQAEVAVGVHRYVLGGRQAGLLLRDQPLLDWRALLGDSMMHDVPDPLVEFQLFETGRGQNRDQCQGVRSGEKNNQFGKK
jgi:hypothetical protein